MPSFRQQFSGLSSLPSILDEAGDSVDGRLAARIEHLAYESQCMGKMALRVCNRMRTAAVRLPAEVLGLIFVFLSDVDHPVSCGRRGDGHLGWIRVLSVCADWRLAALTERRLFAENICDLPGALSELLPLTQQARLVYRVTQTCPRLPTTHSWTPVRWSYYLASFPLSRVSIVDIDSTVNVPLHLWRLIRVSRHTSLPHLKVLRADDFNGALMSMRGTQRGLVAHEVAQLAGLEVVFFRNVWCNVQAPMLKRYHTSFRRTYPRPSLSQVTWNLSTIAHHLCELVLHHSVDETAPTSGVLPHIALPRLEYMRICDRPNTLTDLIAIMLWPTTARIQVRSSLREVDEMVASQHILDLAALLARKKSELSLFRVSYYCGKNDRMYVMIQGWEDPDVIKTRCLEDDPTQPLFQLCVDVTGASLSWCDIFCIVVEALGAEALTMLVLFLPDEEYDTMVYENWLKLFRTVPRVHHLYPHSTIVSSLQRTFRDDPNDTILVSRLYDMVSLN